MHSNNKTIKKNFPADNVPESERQKDSYGIKIGEAIYENFALTTSTALKYDKVVENRMYASGRQDIEQYRTQIDPDIDKNNNTTLLNIDWSITSPLPKLINTVLGGMVNQDHKIQVNAIDRMSQSVRDKKRDELFGNIIKEKYLRELEQQAGIPLLEKKNNVPKDEDEIEMYMEMEYKIPIEIASEEIVDWELYQNDWDKIKYRILRDGIENNKMCARTYFDSNNKIRVRYVDIANYTESKSDDPYSDDSDYQAEVTYFSIRDLRKISDGHLTEQELFEIAQKYAGSKNSNAEWRWGRTYNSSGYYNNDAYDYDDFRIPCLDFVYYTFENNVWEKKDNKYGGYFFNKRKSNYVKPERSKYNREVYKKPLEVSYEGLYIIGYNKKMAKYGKTKNMLRKAENGKISPKIKRQFLYVEPNRRGGESTSIVDLCKPIIDDLQILTLKMRHLIAEVAPPGAMIDINSINNLSLGGKKVSPSDIVKMFKQKGILLFNGLDESGDPTRSIPIQEMINGVQNGLAPLQQQYAFKLDELREISGINKARDASEPDKKALVGIQKLALLNSNNSTRELFDSFLDGVFRRVGDNISIMANYKIQHDNGLEYYTNIIGKSSSDLLKLTAQDFSKAELGIKVEALPTEIEVERLNMDIDRSLQAGEIRLEDAMEVRRILNVKKAERYLMHRRKKYRQEAMEEMAQREQITAERERAAAMAAAEKQKMIELAKAEAKIMIESEMNRLKMEYNNHETINKIKIVDREGMWKQRLIEEAQDERPEDGGSDTGGGSEDDFANMAGEAKIGEPMENNIASDKTKADDMPRIFQNPAEASQRTD